MMSRSVQEIRALAKAIRLDVLTMTLNAGVNGGHMGGALSCADILAVLYGAVMNVSPDRVMDPARDRFLLSKGHVSLALYAALAECGFLAKEDLLSFEKPESLLSTHSVMAPQYGVEIASGSLGYGLSIGVGCALAAKLDGRTGRTFVLLGDGECNEGTVWEAAMAASRFKLGNLTAIVDVNGQQLDGYTANIMPIANIVSAFQGMGFRVVEVDGHNVEELLEAFEPSISDKPTVIIAHTVKCKGIRSIEGKEGWHHTSLTKEQYDRFVDELGA